MTQKLTLDDIERLLQELRVSTQKDECWSCDCLQGFFTQLELDATQEAGELIHPLKVSRSHMHG